MIWELVGGLKESLLQRGSGGGQEWKFTLNHTAQASTGYIRLCLKTKPQKRRKERKEEKKGKKLYLLH